MKRYGEPVKLDISYTPRPGVYGVILHGRKALLTYQSEPEPEIQLPGGGIDPGESILQALHRECLEETGWTICIKHRLGAYQRFTYMPEYNLWAHKICHIYLCIPALKRHAPLESGHVTLWMDVKEAVDMLSNAGDRAFFQTALL